MSLIFDHTTKVWVVLVEGTNHVLYYSISREQCYDYMERRQ